MKLYNPTIRQLFYRHKGPHHRPPLHAREFRDITNPDTIHLNMLISIIPSMNPLVARRSKTRGGVHTRSAPGFWRKRSETRGGLYKGGVILGIILMLGFGKGGIQPHWMENIFLFHYYISEHLLVAVLFLPSAVKIRISLGTFFEIKPVTTGR